jgi:alpha 1,3-glucosidase
LIFQGTLDRTHRHVARAVLAGGPKGSIPLDLTLHFYASGVARARVTEAKTRWQPPDVVLEGQMTPATYTYKEGEGHVTFFYAKGSAGGAKAVRLHFNPFKVDMLIDGETVMTANERNLFHFEHTRRKDGTVVTDSMSDDAGAVAEETRRLAEAAAASRAQAGDATDQPEGKKIVDYNEHGHAIYEDGTTSADEEKGQDGAAADAADGGGGIPDPADPAPPADVDEREPTEDQWEESFGSHRDSKPNGPQSVGVDVTFVGAKHVFGIPEHASKFALKPTDNSGAGAYDEPYRLYNLDVFEYDLDVPMALYGAIPLMVAHSAKRTVAAFWFNPTETFIDVDAPKPHAATGAATSTSTHWISESGLPDLFFIPGPDVRSLYAQYAQMTGTTQLPPLFSLAYHQCRWNYRDEADVRQVDSKFEEHNFPYDVIWLDIEHTDGKRYFTWDKNLFPNPKQLIADVAKHGRKVVTIVDPHLKRDGGYVVHREAQQAKVYVQNKDGGEFDGWCWPGSSSYVDFTNPRARDWWADRFALDKYEGSTLDLYTWNDMNEPSVFNGPEVTMQKDTKAIDGQESREWHNLYGFYMQMATNEGQIRRSPGRTERPFLLSRSFFAGSQRYGAIWTGDNAGKWDHLEIAMPMLLSFNVAGLPFIGSDSGGFFGNPNAELMTRWFQARCVMVLSVVVVVVVVWWWFDLLVDINMLFSRVRNHSRFDSPSSQHYSAYHPFFRAHAHHDAKRREPYVFGEPHTSRLRKAVVARYQLLPFWYTLFHESHNNGMPVMRALWMHYPQDESVFGVDDTFLVGEDLLVKPVTREHQTTQSVYLPGGPVARWYDTEDHTEYAGGKTHSVAAPIDKIPVYQRGGSIVPKQIRVRRSSKLMRYDPYTLVIALDSSGAAQGDLYLDDFHTFAHEQGAYVHRHFKMVQAGPNGVLTSEDAAGGQGGKQGFAPINTVERIVVLGFKAAPKSITTKAGASLDFIFDATTNTLTVRKPGMKVAEDFEVTFDSTTVGL